MVVPSLPGFAFSNPIADIIGPRRAGELMPGLMVQLFGKTRYMVQGGDWGAAIAPWMAYEQNVVAKDAEPTTAEENELLSRRDEILDRERGCSHEQETRPQSLGVALADGPVGAAGWILEKFGNWADLPRRADGSPDVWSRFSEEDLLINIMLYLGPSAMVTATWIKRLEGAGILPAGIRIRVPTGGCGVPRPGLLPDAAFIRREDIQLRPLERDVIGRALRSPGGTAIDARRPA